MNTENILNMLINGSQNGQQTALNGLKAQNNADFMNIITQLVTQSGDSQIAEAVKLAGGEQNSETPISREQLFMLLSQNNLAQMPDNQNTAVVDFAEVLKGNFISDTDESQNVQAEVKTSENSDVKPKQPNVQQVKAEFPETAEVKPKQPNVQQVKVELPETVEFKPTQPNVQQVKAEFPENAEAKPKQPNVQQVKVEIPKTAEVKSTQPNVQQVKAEFPETMEVKPNQPNVQQVKAEFPENAEVKPNQPNVQQVKVEIPKSAEVKSTQPNVQQIKVKLPETVEVKSKHPNVQQVKAEIPETAKVKPIQPNVQQVKAEFPETVEVKPKQPNIQQVKVEIPETVEVKPPQPNIQQAKAEIPKTVEVKPKQPNVQQVKVELPETVEVKPKQPNIQQVKAEIPETAEVKPNQPNVQQVKVELPETAEVKPKQPNIQQVKVEIPETVEIQTQSKEIKLPQGVRKHVTRQIRTYKAPEIQPQREIEEISVPDIDALQAMADANSADINAVRVPDMPMFMEIRDMGTYSIKNNSVSFDTAEAPTYSSDIIRPEETLSDEEVNQFLENFKSGERAELKNDFLTAVPCFTGVKENNPVSINSVFAPKEIIQNEESQNKVLKFENLESVDFSELSADEKVEVVKNAVADGEVTIEKDNDIFSVIRKLTSSGMIEKNVIQVTKSSVEQPEITSILPNAVFDYSKEIITELPELKTDGTYEENLVFNQTLDSIEKAVSSKLDRFIVKLNPKGLGEITVSLEKAETGMIVNLVADNAKTAELLNRQLPLIQTNLTHYNAQVNPATVAETSPTASYDFGQQMMFGGQQFSQHNGGANNPQQQMYYSDDSSVSDEEITQSFGMLNTYA